MISHLCWSLFCTKVAGQTCNVIEKETPVQMVSDDFHEIFNPFKTDKKAANGNLRLCLKWKPQAKCR